MIHAPHSFFAGLAGMKIIALRILFEVLLGSTMLVLR